MPVRAPSVCGYCGKAHRSGEACAAMVAMQKERKARFDKTRPSARQRGYTAEWEKARKEYLAANPVCIRCGAPAALVDHITAHKGNMALFWNRANWQPMCTPCHSVSKQAEERRSIQKGPFEASKPGGGHEFLTPAEDRCGQALTKKFRISSRFNER